ncbi:MAG TPA: hypothetical protein DCQ48_09335, partial [Erythrobacter sp.]|nr:hypothetical protein [Erythrobacter sp.]
MRGQFLAISEVRRVYRLMKFDIDIDPTESQSVKQVRQQIHVAIPGIERPEPTPHRHAVQPGIGDGDRLDAQIGAGRNIASGLL